MALNEVVVLKFGGSVLSDGEGIRRAAEMVKREFQSGLRVMVVVSALKGVTDDLIRLMKNVNPDAPPSIMDEVLSMGERTSAKIFANALLAEGLHPVVIDPSSECWPIVTDERHLDANPIYEETKRRAKDKLFPLLEKGRIPVIGGFIGISNDGKITTLGRGGSDTTAILIGSCLQAKEVVLVKDVETVFSSDPDKVENPIPILTLDSEEAYALSSGGAKFLHSKALHYKDDSMRIRIVSLGREEVSGTVIDGSFPDLQIESSKESVSMITIIGFQSSEAESLRLLSEKVREAGGRVLSLTLGERSAIIYVAGGERLVNKLHESVVSKGFGKALSSFENLSMVTIRGRAMETSPGMIQRVSQPLARQGINIYGLVTISSSIRIFVTREEGERTVSLLKKALMAEEGGV